MNRQLKFWIETIQLRWIIAGLIIYIGFIFLSSQYLILPQEKRYEHYVKRQKEVNETFLKLSQLDVEEAINNINLQLLELDSLKILFESRLLKSKRVNSVFPVIDRYCTKSQLKVVTLEPINRKINVGPDYKKSLIRLSILGRYQDFLKLLNDLEHHQEWILIEELNIAPLTGTEFGRYDLILSVLVEKEKKT